MEIKSRTKTPERAREFAYLNVQCSKRTTQQPQELRPSKIAKFSTVVLENLKPLQEDDNSFSILQASEEDNLSLDSISSVSSSTASHTVNFISAGANTEHKSITKTHTTEGTRSNFKTTDIKPPSSKQNLKVDTANDTPQVAQAIPVLVTDREMRPSDPEKSATSTQKPGSLGYLGLIRAAMNPERKKEFNKERRGGKQNAKLLARLGRRHQEQQQQQ